MAKVLISSLGTGSKREGSYQNIMSPEKTTKPKEFFIPKTVK